MRQIPIKRCIEKFPGGMMVIPLLAGALIHTFFPGTPKFFGSFTEAFYNGGMAILAVFFVCTGASIDIRTTPYILKKGGSLLLTKILCGLLFGLVFGRFLGEEPISSGMFAGLSTLAIVAAMNDTNGGLYCALMEQFGRTKDVGAYSIMSLEAGPFLTMVTLGVAGLSAFPWQAMLGAILPLLVGMLLGNLDHEMRHFLGKIKPGLIPFFAFGLGTKIELKEVWMAGLLGLGIGVAVVAITGLALFFVDRLTGGTGVAGVAAASTAGNAAAVPMIIATANPVYAEAAKSATILVAASVLVTAIFVPILTSFVAKKFGLPKDDDLNDSPSQRAYEPENVH